MIKINFKKIFFHNSGLVVIINYQKDTMMSKQATFILLLFTLIFAACEKQDDYSKILLNYHYQGSFALPIGDSSLSIKNNGINLPPDWQIDSILEKLDSIKLQQIVTFNFKNSVSHIEYIKRLVLQVVTTNDFPAEAKLLLYFADSTNSIVDSLSDAKITILPATVDSVGRVISARYSVNYIEVIKEHFNNWSNVNRIYVVGYIMNQAKQKKLNKYYKDYKLKVEMGFTVDLDHIFHKKVV
jgi:hypothetical protein